MILQRDSEILAQGFHAFVTVTDPFATQFANEIRVLLKTERENTTASALSGFENSHIPVSLLQYVCRRQTCETGTNDDARIRATLNIRTKIQPFLETHVALACGFPST